jgi:hypothetical protein
MIDESRQRLLPNLKSATQTDFASAEFWETDR